PNTKYLDYDGKPTADATHPVMETAPANPKWDGTDPNTKYLDYNGKPSAADTRQTKMDGPNFDLGYSPLTDARGSVLTGSKATQLGDSGLYGGLQSSREILTKKGEFSTVAELAADPKAGSKRGIPYYRNTLDVLARKFADTMNGANGNNGPLFSNSGTNNNIKGITAGNLSVSQGWASGATTICKSTKPNPTSGDTSNIAHIIILLDSKLPYTPGDLDGTLPNATIPYYTGSFQGALCNISATLAHDKSTTTTMLKNYAGAANELATSRDAVSGVELNDEAASLMQYQKSYSAACRLMTTIDEMLDKLINGTGIVGR
ncbi:MAG: flagellar basal body rod C-terminal domain-containing protein, partial [Oscillospiraceae bacterium]